MNFVVISLDCVRTEALSCYGESFPFRTRFPYRAETPNIDSIASESLVFENTFCQAPFTPASHASLFTGLNPYRHGIRGMFNYKLNEDVGTMAERFSAEGYATGAFIGAHALSSQYGHDRGFDRFDEEFDGGYRNWILGNRRSCNEVTSKALSWLEDREDDYLLFLHYFDAHDGGGDYSGDDSGAAGGEDGGLRGLYDSYVRSIDESVGRPIQRTYRTLSQIGPNKAYGQRYHLKQVQRIDEQIGRLRRTIQRRDEYDETTIVILADHGDAFGEHGETNHREYLYDTTLHVPLIVKPGARTDITPRSYDGVVRSIDVFPTLADAAGLSIDSVEGESLYRAVAGESDDERKAYAETLYERSPDDLDNLLTDFVGLRSRRWKLIRDQLNGSAELYDLKHDPDELNDVSGEYSSVREELADELDTLLADEPNKEDNLMTETELVTVRDQLKGLGYL